MGIKVLPKCKLTYGITFVILHIFKSNKPTLSVLFGKGKILIRILKYITCFVFACLLFTACDAISSPVQQKYGNHTVKQGETVFSIAKQYNTSKEVIYNLNPDARKELKVNTVLIVPSKVGPDVIGTTKYKTHKVKRKETLFSLSQMYGVSIDEIKKHNKELYSRGLKKGELIRIPKTSIASETTPDTVIADKNIHVVAPKETK